MFVLQRVAAYMRGQNVLYAVALHTDVIGAYPSISKVSSLQHLLCKMTMELTFEKFLRRGRHSEQCAVGYMCVFVLQSVAAYVKMSFVPFCRILSSFE